MVHAEQIEEKNLQHVCRELKRTRSKYGNSSKTRFEVQDKPRFNKSIPNERPSNIQMIKKGKGSTPKTQEGKISGPYDGKPSCAKCGGKNEGKCLPDTGNCDSFCKSGHMGRYFT